MRTSLILMALGVFSASACVTTGMVATPVQPAASAEVAFGFQSELAPHGEWLLVGPYGRVWRPYERVVGVGFTPYLTGGQWGWTDEGWQFASDLPFAWATFHYGRWVNAPRLGWVWIPGDEWAPAWVYWRHGGGVIGWAPLPPPGVSLYSSAWVFVRSNNFMSPNVNRYRLNQAYAYQRTRPVAPPAGSRWSPGPPPQQIASEIGRPVPRAPAVQGRPPPGRPIRPPPALPPGSRVVSPPPPASGPPPPAGVQRPPLPSREDRDRDRDRDRQHRP